LEKGSSKEREKRRRRKRKEDGRGIADHVNCKLIRCDASDPSQYV
jgi:hypothetical protein